MSLLGDDHDQMCKTKLQIRISRNDTHTAASFTSVALAADFKFSKVLFLGPDSCHRKKSSRIECTFTCNKFILLIRQLILI